MDCENDDVFKLRNRAWVKNEKSIDVVDDSQLWGDEDCDDLTYFEDFEGSDSDAMDGLPTERTIGGISNIILGNSESDPDRLRLKLAETSTQQFQSAWSKASIDERCALLVLRAEGLKLLERVV